MQAQVINAPAVADIIDRLAVRAETDDAFDKGGDDEGRVGGAFFVKTGKGGIPQGFQNLRRFQHVAAGGLLVHPGGSLLGGFADGFQVFVAGAGLIAPDAAAGGDQVFEFHDMSSFICVLVSQPFSGTGLFSQHPWDRSPAGSPAR